MFQAIRGQQWADIILVLNMVVGEWGCAAGGGPLVDGHIFMTTQQSMPYVYIFFKSTHESVLKGL